MHVSNNTLGASFLEVFIIHFETPFQNDLGQGSQNYIKLL